MPQPGPAAPPAPPAPSGAGSRARSAASGIVRRIAFAVVALAVVAGIGYGYDRFTGDPDVAGVGDCLAGAGANDLKVVECTDATAQHKVVGKVEGKTEAEFSSKTTNVCEPYKETETGFWKGEPGKTGYVLCLAPVKK